MPRKKGGTKQRGGQGRQKAGQGRQKAGQGRQKADLSSLYDEILLRAKSMEDARSRPQLRQGVQARSRYQRLASGLPPNPEQHSWYHHHAPFAQNFGDYVCIKRSTLNDLGVFMQSTLGGV